MCSALICKRWSITVATPASSIIASTNSPSLLQLNLEEKIPDLTDRIVVPPDKQSI